MLELDARFLGRESELGVLRAALEQARSGRGGLVAVTGEAGIGKTRLVEELARTTGLSASRMLWGRCSEQEGAPSYWPWSRVVRAYATANGIERLRADLGEAAPLLAPLVPGLLPVDAAGRVAPDGGGARYLLFEAVIGLLRRIAADEPLVMALEDVHWADEASLALLELVAQELEGMPLLLIVTYRDRERQRLPRPLVEAVRRGRRIELQGLDRESVSTLVSQAAGAPAPSALVDRLAELTAGNPFFLGEVLRTLAQEGGLDAARASGAPLTLPDTVRDSIRRHLDPLAEADRDLLALAAVVGQEFDIAVLQEAAHTEPTVVLERLHAAIERGLVVERLAGRFQFAHALVRETLYGDLLPATRVRYHAQVGAALERVHGDDDQAKLGELATHFLHAVPLGTAEKAVQYATRAAERAMALFAYRDALGAYEQALAALSTAAAERAHRLTLRLAAADAAQRAGLDLRARDLLMQAAQDARALGDAGALFLVAIGYYTLRPNVAEADPDTIPLLEEALRAVGEEDGPARATLLAILSTARFSLEQRPEHDALGRAAVEMARRIEDPRVLATTLLARQLVVVAPGSTRERLSLANEALDLAEAHAAGLVHLARGARMHAFLELGDVAAATAEVERMARAADRLRQPERQWQVGVRRAAIALLEGRFDDGARLAAEALAVRRNASDSLALQVFVLQMFLARRDTGRHGGLEGSLRWMVENASESRAWSCVLAVFLADLGREPEARAIFDRLSADGFARLRDFHNYPCALAWMARVCTFLGDRVRAEQLYPLLLPFAEQNLVLGPDSQACLGSTQRYLGLLAMTLAHPDESARHFEAAIAMNERMGARPVLACTEHEYARLLQQRSQSGDRERARELIAHARATSEVCGMVQLLAWIEYLDSIDPMREAELAATTAAASPPAAAPAASPAATSGAAAILRREGDVWLVGFAGEAVHMKDARGVHLLATLLRQPGQEIHALDLVGGTAAKGDESGAVIDRGDAGPLLDPTARAAYKRRLEDLEEELEEAERFNDPARVARARHEIEFLADELSRGVGLGGRERRAGSAGERARVNATRTITAAVKRIGELSPRLGEHLRATIRTGYLCVYDPGPATSVRWDL